MDQKEVIRCPEKKCRSPHTYWVGFFATVGEGPKHRRKCAKCGRSWYPKPKAQWPEDVGYSLSPDALELVEKGLSEAAQGKVSEVKLDDL